MKTAIKAFNRIMAPIAEQMAQGAACDHEFDGGEWSDAASAREAERVEEAVAFRVGQRFGLSTEQMLNAVWVSSHIEQDCFMTAMFARGVQS